MLERIKDLFFSKEERGIRRLHREISLRNEDDQRSIVLKFMEDHENLRGNKKFVIEALNVFKAKEIENYTQKEHSYFMNNFIKDNGKVLNKLLEFIPDNLKKDKEISSEISKTFFSNFEKEVNYTDTFINSINENKHLSENKFIILETVNLIERERELSKKELKSSFYEEEGDHEISVAIEIKKEERIDALWDKLSTNLKTNEDIISKFSNNTFLGSRYRFIEIDNEITKGKELDKDYLKYIKKNINSLDFKYEENEKILGKLLCMFTKDNNKYEDVIEKIIDKDIFSIQYLDKELKNNKEFMTKVLDNISKNQVGIERELYSVLFYDVMEKNNKLKEDKEFVSRLLEKEPTIYHSLKKELREDKKIITKTLESLKSEEKDIFLKDFTTKIYNNLPDDIRRDKELKKLFNSVLDIKLEEKEIKNIPSISKKNPWLKKIKETKNKGIER